MEGQTAATRALKSTLSLSISIIINQLYEKLESLVPTCPIVSHKKLGTNKSFKIMCLRSKLGYVPSDFRNVRHTCGTTDVGHKTSGQTAKITVSWMSIRFVYESTKLKPSKLVRHVKRGLFRHRRLPGKVSSVGIFSNTAKQITTPSVSDFWGLTQSSPFNLYP